MGTDEVKIKRFLGIPAQQKLEAMNLQCANLNECMFCLNYTQPRCREIQLWHWTNLGVLMNVWKVGLEGNLSVDIGVGPMINDRTLEWVKKEGKGSDKYC